MQVVTPNPFSSGSAKWNVLAAYGAERKLGMSDTQATAFVQRLFQHVVSQDTSGSNAANTFLSGKGDVLITYESEAYAALAAGIVDADTRNRTPCASAGTHPQADRLAEAGRSAWPRVESNHRTQLRRLPLYPLSYGAGHR